MGDDAASNIERYLSNPPYFGRSEFADRERVKKLHVGFVKKFGDRVSDTARRARDGLNALIGIGAGLID